MGPRGEFLRLILLSCVNLEVNLRGIRHQEHTLRRAQDLVLEHVEVGCIPKRKAYVPIGLCWTSRTVNIIPAATHTSLFSQESDAGVRRHVLEFGFELISNSAAQAHLGNH